MKWIVSILACVLFFASCQSVATKQTEPPKSMIPLETVETSIINRYWLTSPASFRDWERNTAAGVDEQYYGQRVQVLGKVTYSGSTDLYVGYNDVVGYIYGYIYFVDQDIADLKQSDKFDSAHDRFMAFYDSITPANVTPVELSLYEVERQRAAKSELTIGSKIVLNLIPKHYVGGISAPGSEGNFSILGNPIYSEVADSIHLINYNCIGSSQVVSQILNGTHSDIRRVVIWGTVLDTSYVDPVIQVDYIKFIVPELKEKIIEVAQKK